MMKRISLLISILLLLPATASAERWFADPQKSKIQFSGEMKDGPVTGTFSKYWVDMNFDAADLADAYIKARILTASVHTDTSERNATLKQQEWLYTTLFPDAVFESNTISTADGITFLATGMLTLRGVTGPADINFTFEKDPQYDFAQLVGTVRIKRLDFGVGQGQWLDTSIVGNPVKIVIDLYMRRTLE